MQYSEMKETLKRKFRLHHRCPICHQDVQKFDDCQIVQFQMSMRTVTSFIHTACLVANMYYTPPKKPLLEQQPPIYADTDSVKVEGV